MFGNIWQVLNISNVWQYLANAKRAAAKEVEGGWMEPKQHLSHFISPEHALFYQNTLYSPEKNFTLSEHTLFHQITLYFIKTHFIHQTRDHFISSEHTLFHQNTFYSPEDTLFHQNTLYFIRTLFISSEHILLTISRFNH